VGGGPKMSLFDIRQMDKPLFSQSNNIKNLSSIKMTNDRIITAGLDGHLKIYKPDPSEVLKLNHQFKPCEGILGMNVDPLSLNYSIISTENELSVFQKPYYSKKDTMKNILSGNGLGYLEEEEQNQESVMVSNGKKYSEKDLTSMFSKGFMHNDRGSYKYYQRGLYVKPLAQSHSETIIKNEKSVNLQKYDKLLRKYKFSEALESVLRSGNSLNILGVMEQLMLTDDLETALSEFCLSMNNIILILKFIHKKIISDNCLNIIHYVLERVIAISGDLIVKHTEGRQWLKDIQKRLQKFQEREKKVARIKEIIYKTN
jgi:hypothetical protein